MPLIISILSLLIFNPFGEGDREFHLCFFNDRSINLIQDRRRVIIQTRTNNRINNGFVDNPMMFTLVHSRACCHQFLVTIHQVMEAPSGRVVAPSGSLGPVSWPTIRISSLSHFQETLFMGMSIPINVENTAAVSAWPTIEIMSLPFIMSFIVSMSTGFSVSVVVPSGTIMLMDKAFAITTFFIVILLPFTLGARLFYVF